MIFEVCKISISNPSCVPSWLRWAPFRSIFEHFGLMVRPLKLILGSSLGLLRPLWSLLGLSWGILEPPWSYLWAIWGFPEPFWRFSGSSGSPFGFMLVPFYDLLLLLGAIGMQSGYNFQHCWTYQSLFLIILVSSTFSFGLLQGTFVGSILFTLWNKKW